MPAVGRRRSRVTPVDRPWNDQRTDPPRMLPPLLPFGGSSHASADVARECKRRQAIRPAPTRRLIASPTERSPGSRAICRRPPRASGGRLARPRHYESCAADGVHFAARCPRTTNRRADGECCLSTGAGAMLWPIACPSGRLLLVLRERLGLGADVAALVRERGDAHMHQGRASEAASPQRGGVAAVVEASRSRLS
jgi:hypothetical protein